MSKATNTSEPALSSAAVDYEKLTDPATAVPTPPVHAARLSALVKLLANAEGAVTESIKARTALVDALEKMLRSNRESLASEEAQLTEVTARKAAIEAKKRDVEDSIMRGLSGDLGNGSPAVDAIHEHTEPTRESTSADPERPDIEELTPPPVETLTPTSTPPPQPIQPAATTTTGADIIHEQPPNHTEPAPAVPRPLVPAGAGSDLLSSLSMPFGRPQAGSPATNGSSSKKRKIDQGEEFAGFGSGDAMDGLDDDVAEMLRKDSGGF